MDMGKATCNISFHCFQPIAISKDKMVDIFKSNPTLNIQIAAQSHDDNSPKWFEQFNRINRVFENVVVQDVPCSKSIETLKQDIAESPDANCGTWANGLFDANARLYYDARLMYFLLEYEIVFVLAEDEFKNYVTGANESDIYNLIRSLIVKEKNEDKLSRWGNEIRQKAILECKSLLDSYGFKLSNDSFEIQNNTGNITCVVEDMKDNSVQFSIALQELNKKAERLVGQTLPIELPNGSWLLFNGRFHTLKLSKGISKTRYLPMLFHVQFMWFRLKDICAVLEKVYSEFTFNSEKSYDKISMLIDEMIINVEMLNLHDGRMKMSFEGDNNTVYGVMATHWSIEGLLVTSERYVDMFKGYLERFSIRHSAKLQNRQNSTLFRISMLQIVAMISVWNDYMGILKKDTQEGLLGLICVDGGILTHFNLFLPFILSFIILIIVFRSVRE